MVKGVHWENSATRCLWENVDNAWVLAAQGEQGCENESYTGATR